MNLHERHCKNLRPSHCCYFFLCMKACIFSAVFSETPHLYYVIFFFCKRRKSREGVWRSRVIAPIIFNLSGILRSVASLAPGSHAVGKGLHFPLNWRLGGPQCFLRFVEDENLLPLPTFSPRSFQPAA
jgi:hypothetical protein